jgi:hypothetical protein
MDDLITTSGEDMTFNRPEPDILTISPHGRTLLTIKPDGTVLAADMEAASEAGRVFVESIRAHIAAIREDAK